MSSWGLLPEQVRLIVLRKEWQNQHNLRQRLLGKRSFPIIVSLKQPTEHQLLQEMNRFQSFISAWDKFDHPQLVHWENKNYRSLKNQRIPKQLHISSMKMLLAYLGNEAIDCSRRWEQRMEPLLALNPNFYPVLIKHLATLDKQSSQDIDLLPQLLPQLEKGMGKDLYLRALPLIGIDTKFVETYSPLITDLLDILHDGEISTSGGLLAWLACLKNPSDWFTIRALCKQSQSQLGGFSILQLSAETLQEQPLPAANILVIENMASGLGLPNMENTIAVFGRGRNVRWMETQWLREKNLAYWGDIDSWGLTILSEARSLAPKLQPLMMDKETLIRFRHLMVNEEKQCPTLPNNLNADEIDLFHSLKDNTYGANRLEQERLPADYCMQQFKHWI